MRENAAALAVALSVGGLSFYLVRMLLARDGVESEAPSNRGRKLGRRPATSGAMSEGAEQ